MRQTTLTQYGAPGCVIDKSDFSQYPTTVNFIFLLCHLLILLIFFVWMCPFGSIVSLGVELAWRSGYCYLNKGECNLNQSKDDSFVKRVAKNNN